MRQTRRKLIIISFTSANVINFTANIYYPWATDEPILLQFITVANYPTFPLNWFLLLISEHLILEYYSLHQNHDKPMHLKITMKVERYHWKERNIEKNPIKGSRIISESNRYPLKWTRIKKRKGKKKRAESRKVQEQVKNKGKARKVGRKKRRKNLLNVISGDVVGIIGCHHGLHLHQVLLHFLLIHSSVSLSTELRRTESPEKDSGKEKEIALLFSVFAFSSLSISTSKSLTDIRQRDNEVS